MIKGVYHIGYGVRDDKRSIEFYQKFFNLKGLRLRIEDDSIGGFGDFVGKGERYRWSMLTPQTGKVEFEPVQLLSREPIPIPSDFKWGDIGINEVCFSAVGVDKLHAEMKEAEIDVISEPSTVRIDENWEKRFFYIRDPDGINIKLEEDVSNSGLGPEVLDFDYLCVGVSNIEESLKFYRDMLGYTKIVWDIDGHLEWMDSVVGEKVFGRSVMIGRDYDKYLYQLVRIDNRTPKKLFAGKRWGDIGLLELCFKVDDIQGLCDDLRAGNVKILVEPQLASPQIDYAFIAYAADPDGNYVEFSFHRKKD